MHVPDGFINGVTSAGAAVVAGGGVATALKAGARSLRDRQIPLAGLAAAFVFALQMLNFPVAAGTSGHLLGGALAAILLGPSLGVTVVAVVIVVQALLFADGGVTALGINITNMALITSMTAWGSFRLLGKVLPRKGGSVLVATMIAAWISVVVSSVGFVFEYWLGGQGGVDLGTVFRAMVGVHALIGIGEGLITVTVIGAVLAVRPDLVVGARRIGYRGEGRVAAGRRATAGFVAGGLAGAIALVVFVAPLASSAPDGLNKVALDTGIAAAEQAHPIGGPFAGYGGGGLGVVLSGMVGLVVTYALGLVLVGLARRRARRRGHHEHHHDVEETVERVTVST